MLDARNGVRTNGRRVAERGAAPLLISVLDRPASLEIEPDLP